MKEGDIAIIKPIKEVRKEYHNVKVRIHRIDKSDDCMRSVSLELLEDIAGTTHGVGEIFYAGDLDFLSPFYSNHVSNL